MNDYTKRINNMNQSACIPLNIIINAIEMANEEWNQYLDVENLEIVSLPEYPFAGEYEEEDQKLADLIEEGWQVRFFKLPDQYDIHVYSMMEEFVWSLPSGGLQETMENAIRGKGAFRRFKDALIRFGIEREWYDFRDEKYKEIAIEWCKDHGFDYFDKMMVPSGSSSSSPSLAWEEIDTKHIIQNQWIDFRESTYRFPDGREIGPFYSYSRRDYVVIVASDEDGNYLCVRQFRQGIKEVTTEFPAGGIERKDGKEYGDTCGWSDEDLQARLCTAAEDALEAAKRELREETGYVSGEWQHLLTIPSNATIADNYAYIFTAKNCRRETSQDLDETEFVDVIKHTAGEIEEMIADGRFQQAMHVMAWLLARRI